MSGILQELRELKKFYGCDTEGEHSLSRSIFSSQEKFTSGLLHLINCPPSGDGLYYMNPVVDHLLNAYQTKVGKKLSNDFIKVYESFWDNIFSFHESSGNEHIKLRRPSVRGVNATHPLYTFLFRVSAHGGAIEIENQGMLQTFKSYSPFLLKRIYLLRHDHSKRYIARLGLIARKLIVSRDSLSIEDYFSPTDDEISLLAHDALKMKKILFSDEDKTFVFDLLFRGYRREVTQGHSRKVGRVQKRWLLYENQIVVNVDLERIPYAAKDKYFDVTSKRKKILMQEVSLLKKGGQVDVNAQGESIEDYLGEESILFPAEFFLDPWFSQRNAKQKFESLVQETKVMPWHKDCISKHKIRNILENMATEIWQVQVIIYFAIFLGKREKELKKIYFNRRNSHLPVNLNPESQTRSKGVNYDYKKNILWSYSSYGSRDEERFCQVDDYQIIRLPQFFSQLITEGRETCPLFAKEHFQATKEFLQRFGRDGLGPITIARLAKTFKAYFVHSYGLPQLYADILAGVNTYYLENQHYYVTLNSSHYNQEWQELICSFMSEFKGSSLFDMPVSLDNLFKADEKVLSNNEVTIGATNTPTTDALKKHFSLLYKSFPHDRESLLKGSDDQWNSYIAYLYGLFLVCTGQRPLRDPIPDKRELLIEKNAIHIMDKNSTFHREERCVPIPEILTKSLRCHLQLLLPVWRRKIINEGIYSIENLHCFFPILNKETKSVESSSSKNIDKNTNFTKDSNYFYHIRNGYRHYYLSCLHNSGENMADIDWVSGHRRRGMEHEHVLSPISWLESKTRVLKIQDKIIKDLNLKIVVNDV